MGDRNGIFAGALRDASLGTGSVRGPVQSEEDKMLEQMTDILPTAKSYM